VSRASQSARDRRRRRAGALNAGSGTPRARCLAPHDEAGEAARTPRSGSGPSNCVRRATAASRASWSARDRHLRSAGAQKRDPDAPRARLLDPDGTRANATAATNGRPAVSRAYWSGTRSTTAPRAAERGIRTRPARLCDPDRMRAHATPARARRGRALVAGSRDRARTGRGSAMPTAIAPTRLRATERLELCTWARWPRRGR
jgi:hypothetical protein